MSVSNCSGLHRRRVMRDEAPDLRQETALAVAAAQRTCGAAREAVRRAARIATVTELPIDEAHELRAARARAFAHPRRREDRHEIGRLMLGRARSAVRYAGSSPQRRPGRTGAEG